MLLAREEPSVAYFAALRPARVLRDFIVGSGILSLGHLVAVSLRQQLPFGNDVGQGYAWYSVRPYLVCIMALALTSVLRLLIERAGFTNTGWQLWSPLLAIGLAAGGITAAQPGQSHLETAYFVLASVALVALIIPRRSTSRMTGDLGAHLSRLWRNRSLLRIWVQYNVQSRYAQAILGILWIVLLPLSQALIMTIVFSHLLRISAGDVPFIAFFLAGLVPWGLFNQAIFSGMRSILNAMGLITQINFPREIIVLSALGEALVDSAFMFVAMLVIDAFVGVWPNAYYIWLPVLMAIQIGLMTGLMYLASWLSVLVRDVPQLVSVLLQVLFYLCPIIYPESIVPAPFRFIFIVNPMATLIEAYRGIIVYHRPPEPLTLVYPAALALGLLICGYRLFKANEDTFADMV
jgi:lipopolysaccharide transport system permease protein